MIFLVLVFRSSSALASAYGIAVTGTMIVTTAMALIVVWRVWKWSLKAAIALIVPFLLVDFIFLIANLLKVAHGGWVPLLIGSFIVLVMLTWREGVGILSAKTRRMELPIEPLCQNLEKSPPLRVPGTAVFLTADPASAPTSLLHSLKHYKVLHESNVILTVIMEAVPRVNPQERMQMEKIGRDFTRVILHFGFMKSPNVSKTLALARKKGLSFDIMSTSFFLSRRSVRPDARSGMPLWQDKLFIFLAQNGDDASSYFQLPTRPRRGDRDAGHGLAPVALGSGRNRVRAIASTRWAVVSTISRSHWTAPNRDPKRSLLRVKSGPARNHLDLQLRRLTTVALLSDF